MERHYAFTKPDKNAAMKTVFLHLVNTVSILIFIHKTHFKQFNPLFL